MIKLWIMFAILLILTLAYGRRLPDMSAEDNEASWMEMALDKRETRVRNGYTFITTDLGGERYKCECIDPKGRRIWPGACGSYDKTIGFINCV